MGEAALPQRQQQVRIGVLALQGSFREHMALLSRVAGVEVVEVRTKEELEGVAGLVIPGGESTTMALVAERWGLIPELQSFHKAGKPIWGTCAGMIFLAEAAEGELRQGGFGCIIIHSNPPALLAAVRRWVLLGCCCLLHDRGARVGRCRTVRGVCLKAAGRGAGGLGRRDLTLHTLCCRPEKGRAVLAGWPGHQGVPELFRRTGRLPAHVSAARQACQAAGNTFAEQGG